ncbi:MAG: dTMP kinase [Candidatus Zhuqueibacterota bacterium]
MAGTLITFEGIDFCGKSVQIQRLVSRFREEQIPFQLFREPGGTIIAEKIRSALLTIEDEAVSPIAEYLLYSAARAQVVKEKIMPALQQGALVICDRFYDSSTAYQGYGRNIDIELVHQINRLATQGLKPTLTFFIDISLEEMEQRKQLAAENLDRMERESRDFFRRVRAGYFRISQEEPERFVTIDGSSTIDSIAETIWHAISNRIRK